MRSRKDKLRAEARRYFANEESLTKDWYSAHYTLHVSPGVPLASYPPLAEMRRALDEWLHEMHDSLYNLICVEWDYCSRRQDEELQDDIALAAWLAEILASAALKVPLPIGVAVIMVQRDLDRFCGCGQGRPS